MPDNTNVNNNAAVVVVGRTAPVPPGQQDAANSVPVVIATDQTPIPVVEQNKQQSEVALSLLGIPRSEVALGIFADVNTYDVNPSEWSTFPEQFTTVDNTGLYSNIPGDMDWGLTHIAEEAGALIEAPADKHSILTSKRFFRYQPGRVSAATFGVKLTPAPYTIKDGGLTGDAVRNPSIKKYGIFDKFDGYYFESRNDGKGDNFACVRRTQSIVRFNPKPYGTSTGQQVEDYADTGIGLTDDQGNTYLKAYELIKANKWYLMNKAAESTATDDKEKCARDVGYVIEGYLDDLRYGGNANTVYNIQRYYNQKTGELYVDANSEVTRHTVVRNAILNILDGVNPGNSQAYYDSGEIVPPYPAGSTGFGLAATIESGAEGRINELSGIIIAGLTSKSSIPNNPTGATYGDMCILRDGLIMTHAAAFDVSLLKSKANYVIDTVDTNENEVIVTVPDGEPNIEIGQSFYYYKNGDSGDITTTTGSLADGEILYALRVRVRRDQVNGTFVTQNIIQLTNLPCNEESYASDIAGGNPTDPWTSNPTVYSPEIIDLTPVTPAISTTNGHTLTTPTPFLLPTDTRKYNGSNYSDRSFNLDLDVSYADGCFPYLYPSAAENVSLSVGYIDTAIDGSTGSYDTLRTRINYVNKRLYKKWTQFNVDPKFYKVYEYRVPRSRFSGEKVNGSVTDILYSDNVLDFYAGEPVIDETSGETLQASSIWDLDPEKVTMYKIEFSWYGAVGATFLAYVPISNGEARWVRVHHLRASNQLKVASLGNATLPITYMVYGGGSEVSGGYKDDARIQKDLSGAGSYSEYITKYGASYYIDGGDRGTVRLFSYASDNQETIYGSKYRITGANCSTAQTAIELVPGATYVNAPYIDLTNAQNGTGMNGAPNVGDYYMNSKIISGNSNDQNVRVVWVDVTNKRLYLNKALVQNGSSVSIDIVVDRPTPLIGIKCREEINGIRNRVQIYPTRLATGSSGVLTVQLLKSPKFQTFDTYVGSLSISGGTNSYVDIGRRGKRIALTGETTESAGVGNFMSNGASIYGYFRYTLAGDASGNAYTMLGLLEKIDGVLYFTATQKTANDVLIRGAFMPAGNYTGPNPSVFTPPTSPYAESTLNDLSAILTVPEQRTPIPGTGQVVTTLFSSNAGTEFDLSPYFDYNKDYLSFPLTNQVESLYVCAASKAFYRDLSNLSLDVLRGDILASLTWEEQ
jgi:hypothetical protein